MEPSQPMKEEPYEEQQYVGKEGKCKRKAHTIPTPSVPTKVTVPSLSPPPFAPMSQNNKNNVDLHFDDIALILNPSQVVIASIPLNFIFQHVVVEASDGSNIYKVSTFVMNESITNMLENAAIGNLVLMFAFEFVKNVSKLELY